MDLSSVEHIRKRYWKNFLFKKIWLVNVFAYVTLVLLLYFIISSLFPEWFISSEMPDCMGDNTPDDIVRRRLRNKINGSIIGGFITFLMFLTICFIKYAYYKNLQTKGVLEFVFQEEYWIEVIKPYSSFIESVKEKEFPIEHLANSGHIFGQTDVAKLPKRKKGFLIYSSPRFLSGHYKDLEFTVVNPRYYHLFKHKGSTSTALTYFALLICVKLPYDYDEKVLVERDRTEKFFGKLGQKGKVNFGDLISLDDQEFERNFKISSTVANPKILDEDFKKVLLDLKTKDKNLKLSVNQGWLYISIPSKKNLLTLPIWRKLKEKEARKNVETLDQILEDIFRGIPKRL